MDTLKFMLQLVGDYTAFALDLLVSSIKPSHDDGWGPWMNPATGSLADGFMGSGLDGSVYTSIES
jgi:hypothetical protein